MSFYVLKRIENYIKAAKGDIEKAQESNDIKQKRVCEGLALNALNNALDYIETEINFERKVVERLADDLERFEEERSI